MSGREHIRGKLTPVFVGNTESFAEMTIKSMGGKLDSKFYSTWLEQFKEVTYGEYFVDGDTIYLIEKEAVDADDDISIARRKINGDVFFNLRYHNGTTSLNEALKGSLEKIKDEPIKVVERPDFEGVKGLKDDQIATLTNDIRDTLQAKLIGIKIPASLRVILSDAICNSLNKMDARADHQEAK